MYLQGNLQKIFDALYELGIIDPILDMDWTQALDRLPEHFDCFIEALDTANRHQENMTTLLAELKKMNELGLNYLAMEVAREFADYHAREILH
ncbi:MAG: cytochrome [Bdellovibrionales bacterium]|nr:cytochrome [Bdellovibrionales bacterium]